VSSECSVLCLASRSFQDWNDVLLHKPRTVETPGTRDQGPGTRDQGPGTGDRGPGTGDPGPSDATSRPRKTDSSLLLFTVAINNRAHVNNVPLFSSTKASH
jgi:hypothetical protein